MKPNIILTFQLKILLHFQKIYLTIEQIDALIEHLAQIAFQKEASCKTFKNQNT